MSVGEAFRGRTDSLHSATSFGLAHRKKGIEVDESCYPPASTTLRNSVAPLHGDSMRAEPLPASQTEHQAMEPDRDDDASCCRYGCCELFLMLLSILLFLLFFPIMLFTQLRIVKDYERVVILRFGKPIRRWGNPVLGAGVRFVMPFIDDLLRIDLRLRTINIAPQEVLTSDAVTANVDAVVYLRITEPASALLRIEDVINSAEMLSVGVLRTVIGHYSLTDLLSSRDIIVSSMRSILDEATDPWGVKVERIEMKDVSLPRDMQRAMAAEAQASRAAKAKIIAAQGEMDASKLLQLAAEELQRSPAALQLRYLQTLATIATENNSTVIFPLPIELLSHFGSKLKSN